MSGVVINNVQVDISEVLFHPVRSNRCSATQCFTELREDWCTRQGFHSLNLDVSLSVELLEEVITDYNNSYSN